MDTTWGSTSLDNRQPPLPSSLTWEHLFTHGPLHLNRAGMQIEPPCTTAPTCHYKATEEESLTVLAQLLTLTFVIAHIVRCLQSTKCLGSFWKFLIKQQQNSALRISTSVDLTGLGYSLLSPGSVLVYSLHKTLQNKAARARILFLRLLSIQHTCECLAVPRKEDHGRPKWCPWKASSSCLSNCLD